MRVPLETVSRLFAKRHFCHSSISVVDQALEIVQEYQSRILKLEKAVLQKPQVKHVVRREYCLVDKKGLPR